MNTVHDALVESPVLAGSEARLADGPFHQGERDAQRRAGVTDIALANGQRSIRNYLPEQHRDFYRMLPFMVFGGIDRNGQPWATLRANHAGFVSSPDPRTLIVEAGSIPGDPLQGCWVPGAMVGGLGIQPHTKRRNRVNGVIRSVDGDVVTIDVTQSFGNCAKYINGREPSLLSALAQEVLPEKSAFLSEEDQALIAHADVFFIASANLEQSSGFAQGVDVSHRGGRPGFIRIDDARTLTTPDFRGNKFFNTLGNLLRDPRAGLLFVDFERGDMLYVAARAEIIWDGPEIARFELAERVVRYHITEVRRTRGALPLRWSAMQLAPQFDEVVAPASPPTWLKLRIAHIEDESTSVRSFYLESENGVPLPAFSAGQHLTVRIPASKSAKPLIRNYTLSSADDARQPRRYRISVKKAQGASAWLHEYASVGELIDAMPPRGTFVLNPDSGQRPPVFLSAGIGITPMLAMLDQYRAQYPGRPAFLLYGVRGKDDRPFVNRLQEIARADSSIKVHVFDSAAQARDDRAQSDEHDGRITIESLKGLLPFNDYDFYLCGPEPFMRSLYEGLLSLNVDNSRIRFEAFGPSSIKRSKATREERVLDASPATDRSVESSIVTFRRSGKTSEWRPAEGSLLDLAESKGIDAPSNCKVGQCGTCSTRVIDGTVRYPSDPEAEIASGTALLCVAHPSSETIVLDL